MTPTQKDFIKATLQKYGGDLNESDIILNKDGGSPTSIRVEVKARRLRFIDHKREALVMSGPVTIASVENFVENYWYWRKP